MALVVKLSRWRVVGTYKPPDGPRRRIQTTVEASTNLKALAAHKARVPPALRRYWLRVQADLLVGSETEIRVSARKWRDRPTRA